MNVKVVNFRSNSVEQEVLGSVQDTGFVVLTHHGIDYGLIKEVQSSWRQFFLAAQEYKDSFRNDLDGNLGFKGFKGEKAVGVNKELT